MRSPQTTSQSGRTTAEGERRRGVLDVRRTSQWSEGETGPGCVVLFNGRPASLLRAKPGRIALQFANRSVLELRASRCRFELRIDSVEERSADDPV